MDSERLQAFVKDPNAVLLVHTAGAANKVIEYKPAACKIIATSPDAFFVLDDNSIEYEPAEKFGLDIPRALERVRNELRPTKIGYFSDSIPGPRRNVFAELLSKETSGVESFQGVTEPPPAIEDSRRIRSLLKSRPRLYYLLRIRRSFGVGAALKLLFYQLSSKPILLLNSGYCWDYVHEALHKKGYAIWGQINLGMPGEGKLGDALRWLEKKKPRAVIYSINPTKESREFIKAARSKNIPVIGWQHGDVNYTPGEQIARDDLEFADLFLNWGTGSQKNLGAAAMRYNLSAKQVAVGSSYLDNLKKTLVLPSHRPRDAGSLRVTYATSMYYFADRSDIHGMEWSDFRLYEGQREIIRRLAGIVGEKVVKLHPSLRYRSQELVKYCESFAKKRVSIVSEPLIRAAEVFANADVIIIDVLSTTLLEALLFDVPVFCLAGQPAVLEDAMRMLEKRAVCSRDPSVLMSKVEEFVRTGKYGADIGNHEFLEAYGTQPGFMASGRAAEEVHRLVG